ncbi:MAG TPA: CPBP family intramembrane metalloprotease [Myxococcota bacterium]|nr:CPBP family intramembrane metalloprotease [Myxococcota bacterium]
MPWSLASADWSQPPPTESSAAAVLCAATLIWAAYHFATTPAFVRRLHPDATTPDALSTATAWHRKLLGALLFSAVSLACGVAFDLPLGLNHDHLGLSFLWTLGPFAVLAPLIAMMAQRPAFHAHYPEVRTPLVGPTRLANAAAWLAFLFGYELFFRGLLVLGLSTLIGPLPATGASLMLYVVTHLHKYPGEALGSFAMGLLLSLVALETGSLVMPLALHLLIAVTTDELASRARSRATPAQPTPAQPTR